MTKFRLIAVSLFLTALFIGSTFAQTTGKVGILNPDAFKSDKGITKLVNAVKLVDKEFEQQIAGLRAIDEKIAAVRKEGQAMAEAYEKNRTGPIGPTQIQAKADELERLQTELTRKDEDVGNAYSRRLAIVTGPIYDEIQKNFDAFVKEKGYTVILDARPFGRTQENPNGISVFVYVAEAANVTAEFIAYCNTKMVAGATPPPPTKPAPTKP